MYEESKRADRLTETAVDVAQMGCSGQKVIGIQVSILSGTPPLLKVETTTFSAIAYPRNGSTTTRECSLARVFLIGDMAQMQFIAGFCTFCRLFNSVA